MSNLKNIQFLRNKTNYASLEAAKTALIAQAANVVDGSPIIGRYNGENSTTKSVLGIVANGTVTFFENANELAARLAALQSELDTTQGAVGTNADGSHIASSSHFTSAATTVEGEIAALAAALEALNANTVSEENSIVTDVTESEGLISATTSLITSVKLSGLTSGTDNKIASTDTLGGALANIQAQINAMDKDADAVDGQVVTTVTEADGKVTETKANVKDLQLGGYAKTNDTGDIASADTINVALSKLENKAAAITIDNEDGSINVSTSATGTDINVNIKSREHVLAKDGNAGVYTDIKISGVTPSSTNVKEEYSLIATDGTVLGTNIKIYKDSALKEIYLGSSADTIDAATGEITKQTVTDPQSLNYAYQLADGTYSLVKVDVSKFLTESEFASGVTQNGAGVVTGVVNSNSESVITAYNTSGDTTAKVLSVGENGFAVNNIQAAIDAAVGKATTVVDLTDDSVSGTAVGVNEHVTLSSATADNGQVTYTIHTNDIASKTDLETEIARAKRAEAALDSVLGATKADDSETRTWTKTGMHYINSGVTVKSDLEILDGKLFETSGKTLTNVTSENASITPTITTHTDGTKTVDLATDTSKIKLSGYTESSATTEQAPANGDTISEALAKIYATAKHHHASGSEAISVSTETSGSTISLILDDTSTVDVFNGDNLSGDTRTNALTITEDGLFLSKNWDCGTF